MLLAALLSACRPPSDVVTEPILGDPIQVVPGDGLPTEVQLQPANNNLGVVEHDGRTYLAWRTAPSHFASPDTVVWVVSSADRVTWEFEATFTAGTDLREVQFLSWNGELWLYCARLGPDPTDFEPGAMMVSHQDGRGSWSPLVEAYLPGFIPWRTRVVDGVPYMIGYSGGENVYDPAGEPIEIHWLTTEDGTTWQAAVGDDPVVQRGGGSETDWTFLADGSLVAVTRNEAGDELGFGSKICTAPAADLGTWTCAPDPRKYDSPLIVREGDDVWLIARRTLENDGKFDLGRDDLDHADAYLQYQAAYWFAPKRCALWRVDAGSRSVSFVADLPSRGDTCFPDAVPRGDGLWEVYNYTSPLDGPDVDWITGQGGDTRIYRVDLQLPTE